MTRLFHYHLRRLRRPDEPRELGQALVETALTLVILLILLTIIIDLGRAFFTYLALQNAAGEGAYYASAFPDRLQHVAGTPSANPNNAAYRALNESPSGLVQWSAATVSFAFTPTRVCGQIPGDKVHVTLRYTFQMVGPLPSLLGVPTSFPLVARADQVVLRPAGTCP